MSDGAHLFSDLRANDAKLLQILSSKFWFPRLKSFLCDCLRDLSKFSSVVDGGGVFEVDEEEGLVVVITAAGEEEEEDDGVSFTGFKVQG